MSLTYGFYNSIAGDRKYNAVQMSSIFDGIINDGVFMSIGDALIVSASGGMNVVVGSGRAWFNHTWTDNDAEIVLAVSQSELILNRIDAVVLEVNSGDAIRANSIKIVKGTPGSVPVNPVMVATELINQHPLCYIYVAAGVTSIVQANITNTVGTSECPFITGLLETVDIDDLLMQWQNQFSIWFATLQDILDTDTAANLLNLINGNTADILTLDGEIDLQAANMSKYENITANGQYVGEISTEAMAVSCSVYDLLYMSSTGYNKSQAADDTKLPCVAMCVETGVGNRKVLKRGYIRNDAWNLTKGQLLYISTSSPGTLVNSKPSTTGNRVQIVGYVVDVHTIYFNPQYMWIEVA